MSVMMHVLCAHMYEYVCISPRSIYQKGQEAHIPLMSTPSLQSLVSNIIPAKRKEASQRNG